MEATPYFSTYCLGFLSSWVLSTKVWGDGMLVPRQIFFFSRQILFEGNSIGYQQQDYEQRSRWSIEVPSRPQCGAPGWKLLETTTREGRGRWGRAGHNCPLRVLQRALGTYHHDWGWGKMWGGVYRHRPTLKFTSCTMSVHLEISKPQFPQL